MFFERRKNKRKKVEDRLVNCICSGSKFKAKVVDISEDGMKIDIKEPLGMDQEIDLFMEYEDGKELRRKAIVVWFMRKSHPAGSRVGLKFTGKLTPLAPG